MSNKVFSALIWLTVAGAGAFFIAAVLHLKGISREAVKKYDSLKYHPTNVTVKVDEQGACSCATVPEWPKDRR
jgi:hypothetical protein